MLATLDTFKQSELKTHDLSSKCLCWRMLLMILCILDCHYTPWPVPPKHSRWDANDHLMDAVCVFAAGSTAGMPAGNRQAFCALVILLVGHSSELHC